MIQQLIINGNLLPKTSHDKYWCHEVALGEDKEMISGRIVTEIRGMVYECHYEYDAFPDALWRTICGDLRRRAPLSCYILPDSSDEPIAATMKCTELINPTFAFEVNGKPRWHNIAFTLREEYCHD